MGIVSKNWLLFALAAALLWTAADARKPAAPSTVRDLVYGEILFEFYQDRYLEAITLQLVAEQKGSIQFHGAESELLSGGMYLAYGQQDQAEVIFDRLLTERASIEVQQQARLQLARSHYQRGSLARTVALIGEHEWDKEIRDEAQSLAARAMLGLGLYQQAELALRDLDRSPAAAFARYNLGVALAGQGQFDQASRQLRIVGDLPTGKKRGLFRRKHDVDPAMPALRDKARLALGYAQIRNGAAEEALHTLEEVDLAGPYASASLLGAGWAAAEMQRFDIALNAWRVLQERDPADPAVQEAWFAVPYALGELSAHDQAADAFEHSIAAIEDEDSSLSAAIDALQRDGLAGMLLAADQAVQWDAGWQLAEAPDHALSRYLFLLMADNVFQQHLRDYRDLQTLSELLNHKHADLASYRNMIDARERRFALRAPLAEALVNGSRSADLLESADAIRSKIDQITSKQDYLRLADADELEQLARLDQIATKTSQLPAADATAMTERQRVLQGLLIWRLSAQYPARLHELKRELATVETQYAETEIRMQKLEAALQSAPATHQHFSQRLDAMNPRIETTRIRIAMTLQQTDQRLVDLATDELQERRNRLAQYLDQARYALAAIHDRAAAEGS